MSGPGAKAESDDIVTKREDNDYNDYLTTTTLSRTRGTRTCKDEGDSDSGDR